MIYKNIWKLDDALPTFTEDISHNPGQTLTPTIVSNYLNLVFTLVTDTGNMYLYDDMSSISDYVVVAGLFLEYDVYWDTTDALIACDLTCSDSTVLRDSGAVDQNGISAHPNTAGLGVYANQTWHHRKIALPASWTGKTISKFDVACEFDSPATLTGRLRKIALTDGSVKVLYKPLRPRPFAPGIAR